MKCVGRALVPRGDALAFHVGTCERERHKSGGLRHHFGSLAVASRPLDIPKHEMPDRDKKIRFTWPPEPRTHHQRENDPPESGMLGNTLPHMKRGARIVAVNGSPCLTLWGWRSQGRVAWRREKRYALPTPDDNLWRNHVSSASCAYMPGRGRSSGGNCARPVPRVRRWTVLLLSPLGRAQLQCDSSFD